VTQLLGPDGEPLALHNGRALDRVAGPMAAAHLIAQPQAIAAQHGADSVIAKTVRSRATSLAYSAADRERGKPKPTPINNETLRLMARHNEWVAAVIRTRKNQLGKEKWKIALKDSDDTSGAARKAAKQIERMMQRPSMYGSRPNSRSWRAFLGMWIEDLLVLDRGCIEKERNRNGWIIGMYPVDGATIRPNIDAMGGYYDDAYVQLVDGQVTARFGMEELICTMDNELTDVRFAGYGMSPLEQLIVSVTAELHAAKYNSSYFERGSVPEGLMNLGEDASPEDVDAFRVYWANEIQGKPWAFPIIGGSKAPEYMQWRDNNRDMQFMEYQQWLLKKICAVYQLAPQDLGELEDVNRSTADSQDTSSREKGLEPLMQLVKETMDLEVLGEHGCGLGDYLEFSWEEQGESAEEINTKFQPMHSAGVATGGEWRDAHGMDPDGDPKATHGKDGLRMHLKEGTPLPGQEDADVMGAAAQQDHEQSLADQEPGDPSNTPWQPADPDHPETAQAMAEHDKESGIGPRNVRKRWRRRRGDVAKSHPLGHDRNPALTHRQDSLDAVFEREGRRLVEGLTRLLADEETPTK
jgi:phage portal protein BeeE